MNGDVEQPIFSYSGEVYVRPCGRGICLKDFPDGPQLEDALPEGEFVIELVVRRKPPNEQLSGCEAVRSNGS